MRRISLGPLATLESAGRALAAALGEGEPTEERFGEQVWLVVGPYRLAKCGALWALLHKEVEEAVIGPTSLEWGVLEQAASPQFRLLKAQVVALATKAKLPQEALGGLLEKLGQIPPRMEAGVPCPQLAGLIVAQDGQFVRTVLVQGGPVSAQAAARLLAATAATMPGSRYYNAEAPN